MFKFFCQALWILFFSRWNLHANSRGNVGGTRLVSWPTGVYADAQIGLGYGLEQGEGSFNGLCRIDCMRTFEAVADIGALDGWEFQHIYQIAFFQK